MEQQKKYYNKEQAMGKKYLHLVGDYTLEVLSYYIWGEKINQTI